MLDQLKRNGDLGERRSSTNLRCLSLELCLSTGLARGSSASGSLKLSNSRKYGCFPDKLAGMGLLLSESDSKSVSDVTVLARFCSPAAAAEGRRVLFDRGRLEDLNKAIVRELT